MKSARHNIRGFTLTELLITVAIIVLLVSLVIVIFRPMQDSAHQANSLAALRQVGAAFSAYSSDHRQRFLPGYLGGYDGNDHVETLTPRSRMEMPPWFNASHADGFTEDELRSYVWRLTPYVDGHWRTFYEDTPQSPWVSNHASRFASEDGPDQPEELITDIAQSPSFGMNSIFVGGDSEHGGDWAISRNPWNGSNPRLAATRLSQVREPARLIAFGAAAPASPTIGDDPDDNYLHTDRGYAEFRAPYLEQLDSGEWDQQQWEIGLGGRVVHADSASTDPGAGFPIERSAAGVPTVMIDGSTEAARLETLAEDMSRWSPDGFRPPQ